MADRRINQDARVSERKSRVCAAVCIKRVNSSQHLPANCLIGELLHPIELLLHCRSVASLVFQRNASEPGGGGS